MTEKKNWKILRGGGVHHRPSGMEIPGGGGGGLKLNDHPLGGGGGMDIFWKHTLHDSSQRFWDKMKVLMAHEQFKI